MHSQNWQRFAKYCILCWLAACGTPDAEQSVMGPSGDQARLGTPPSRIACPVVITTKIISAAGQIREGRICGREWSIMGWFGGPDTLGIWNNHAQFSKSGTLEEGLFSSFTITVLQMGGTGTIRLNVGDVSGNVLESVIVTTPGTYTLRHPGIRRVDIDESCGGLSHCRVATYGNMSFEPDCATPGDQFANPILESAEVRAGLVDALNRSNVDSSTHRRIERGGWIYQRPDGSYFTVPYDDPQASACEMTLPGAPFNPDGVPVAAFHTHPHNEGDPIHPYDPVNEPLGCRKYKPGDKVNAAPLDNGGGSDPDWGASVIGPPLYVIAKAKGTMFFLDPNRWDRPSNPYKFKYNRSDPGTCAPRIS